MTALIPHSSFLQSVPLGRAGPKERGMRNEEWIINV